QRASVARRPRQRETVRQRFEPCATGLPPNLQHDRVMVTSPEAQRGRASRNGRYTWLLALVVVVGIGATLSISYSRYRAARTQWIASAASDAQRLSSLLLGWVDESYAPLSGLAAMIENSHGVTPTEFLNAFEGIESRAAAVLLNAAAMLEQGADGGWRL